MHGNQLPSLGQQSYQQPPLSMHQLPTMGLHPPPSGYADPYSQQQQQAHPGQEPGQSPTTPGHETKPTPEQLQATQKALVPIKGTENERQFE